MVESATTRPRLTISPRDDHHSRRARRSDDEIFSLPPSPHIPVHQSQLHRLHAHCSTAVLIISPIDLALLTVLLSLLRIICLMRKKN
jgi:hypothetical protein